VEQRQTHGAARCGRTLALLSDPPADADTARGYLDLLGPASSGWGGPGRRTLAQALMNNPVVPAVYERIWRPVFATVVRGRPGPGPRAEYRLVRDLLQAGPGDAVLDVACGPGNVTRSLARTVGSRGLVVGLDASADMLARAVRDSPYGSYGNVEYVRGDAVRLPFGTASFDSVCCWAGLHLFEEPFRALAHMVRVLAPGGRLAVLTSHRRPAGPLRALDTAVGTLAGVRMFADDALTRALRGSGLVDVERQLAGATQIVSARKLPEPA
jgi:SAM-dependent methyltransferase